VLLAKQKNIQSSKKNNWYYYTNLE